MKFIIIQFSPRPVFHCLGRAKESVQVWGALKHFLTNYFFTVRGC
jgi:hypothetical protein